MKLAIAVLLFMLIGLQYRLWVGDGSLSEVVQLKAELQREKKVVENLTKRNEKLETRVIELQSGTVALEEIARKDLGMIKKDETFFQIVEPKKNSNKKSNPQ